MGAKKETKWYKSWGLKQICIAVAAAIATVYILMFFLKGVTRHGQKIEVPQFTGMTVGEAQRIAKKSHLRLQVVDSVYVSRLKPGMVFTQRPLPGSDVKKNRRIILTINSMVPKSVVMPNLVGCSLRQAESNINAAQLKVGRLIYVEDIATNNILGQSRAGASIAPGTELPADTEIDLTVGLNPNDNRTYIPNLIETPYNRVKRELVANSLNLGKVVFDSSVKSYSDTLQAVVYRQEPPHSSVFPVIMGTRINLYMTLDRTLAAKSRAEAAAAAAKEAAMSENIPETEETESGSPEIPEL